MRVLHGLEILFLWENLLGNAERVIAICDICGLLLAKAKSEGKPFEKSAVQVLRNLKKFLEILKYF